MKLGKNHYEIRVRAVHPRTGKRREVRREVSCNLTAARARQERLREELESAMESQAPERKRLEAFAGSWLSGRIANGELKPSSARKIATVWDLHIAPTEIAGLYIDDIRSSDVVSWLAGQREKTFVPGHKKSKRTARRHYSPSAIRGQFRVLRTILEAATIEAGVRNPCDGVKPPTPKPPRGNFLRPAELDTVLVYIEKIAPFWYPAVLLDILTGLRWGELSALRWDDLDEESGVIRVCRGNWKGKVIDSTKTGRNEWEPKTVPLLPELAALLREHRKKMIAEQHLGLRAGWLFPNSRGGLHSGSPISKVLPKALAAASVDRRVTVHGLRHTANDLLKRVADDEIVRAIIGHSTPQMTRHYSHIEESEKAGAARKVLQLIRKGVPKGVVEMKPATQAPDPEKQNPAKTRG